MLTLWQISYSICLRVRFVIQNISHGIAICPETHNPWNRDSRISRQPGYKHAFCQNVVSTYKITSPHIFAENLTCIILPIKNLSSRSQWPRGLRSATTRLLVLRVRIPPGAWMCVCCECCVLSGRGLCDRPITRPEESYRVRCVWVWFRNLNNEDTSAH